MKKLVLVTLLGSLGSISAANAQQVSQNLNVIANITPATGNFTVTPTAGSWPTQSLNVIWNSVTNSFTNPSGIGIRVSSSADVTASLSAPAKLISGQAEIPLNVAVTASDSKGVSINNLSMTPGLIYSKATNGQSEMVNYSIDIMASTTGMKDSSGAVIAAGNPPAAGSYSGSVGLIFESTV